jgi:hypothetical protein
MNQPRMVLLSLLSLCVFWAAPALAQVEPSAPALTPSYVLTTGLAVVVGFLTMAYNTGSVFGVKTVPKPALPYVGLAITFLGAMAPALGTGALTVGGLYAAFLAGAWALLGNFAGAAGHSLMTAHKSSRGVAATVDNIDSTGGGAQARVGSVVGGLTNAVDEGSKLAAHRESAYRRSHIVGTRLAWPLWLQRLVVATTTFVGVGLIVALGVGANCDGITPQTQAEIQAAEVLGACVEQVYVDDTAKTPPVAPLQIAVDEGTVCGADVGTLINTFGASSDPGKEAVVQAAQANASLVHSAAIAHKATK